MKKHFKSHLFERGRAKDIPKGIRLRRKKVTEDSADDLPTKEGSRYYRDSWNSETIKEYGPIYKFLQSRLGRKWDDVYSEICKVADHAMRKMVDHCVVTNTCIGQDGKIYDSSRLRWPIEDGGYWKEYYVHPLTKVLCCTVKSARTRRSRNPDYILFDGETTPLVYISDTEAGVSTEHGWFILKMAKVPEIIEHISLVNGRKYYVYAYRAYDVFLGEPLKPGVAYLGGAYYAGPYFGKYHGMYCVAKKQMNKKEIEKYTC